MSKKEVFRKNLRDMKEVFKKGRITSREFPVILFDASGVLFHPQPSFAQLYKKFLDSQGETFELERVEQALVDVMREFNRRAEEEEFFELKPQLWAAHIFSNLRLEQDRIKKLHSAWIDFASSELKMVIPQGSVDLLQELKDRGYRLGLVSNWQGLLSDFVRHQDMMDLFQLVLTAADVGFYKPRPEIFEAALEDLGVEASQCVFVGGSYAADIVGARKLHMRSFLYDPQLLELKALEPEDISQKVVSFEALKQNRRLLSTPVIRKLEEFLEIFL